MAALFLVLTAEKEQKTVVQNDTVSWTIEENTRKENLE